MHFIDKLVSDTINLETFDLQNNYFKKSISES